MDCYRTARRMRELPHPIRLKNRIPGQGHRHTRTSFGRNHELMRPGGVNPLRSCDTGRNEQTEFLVVFGRERNPFVEKRPVDRPLARLDFTPKRPQQDTLDLGVCPARLFGEVAGGKI